MRRVTIRTRHHDATTIAAAVSPDNTDEMTTLTDGDVLETRIHRRTTGGLRTSLDDYLVNVDVAERTYERTKTDTHTSITDTESRQ